MEIILNGINVFYVVLAIFAFILIKSSIVIVPQTKNYIVERFGKYNKTLTAGINIIVPIFDKVAHRVSVLERVVDFPKAPVFTKDNVEVFLSASVYYRVSDSHKSVYRIDDLANALQTTIFGQLRSVIGSMETDMILSNRAEINEKISQEIKDIAEDWGIQVTRTEILEVDFDKEITAAMKSQLVAERKRRAVVIESEGEKRSVELKADAKLYDVQKSADAELYQAEKMAEAVIVAANAERERIELIGKAIKDNGMAAVNFELVKGQIKAMEKVSTSDNTKLIFAPNDMSGALSAVAGVSDLWKNNSSILNRENN